eukprot:355498-Chlamydomonas_euryale.AAC.3
MVRQPRRFPSGGCGRAAATYATPRAQSCHAEEGGVQRLGGYVGPWKGYVSMEPERDLPGGRWIKGGCVSVQQALADLQTDCRTSWLQRVLCACGYRGGG